MQSTMNGIVRGLRMQKCSERGQKVNECRKWEIDNETHQRGNMEYRLKTGKW